MSESWTTNFIFFLDSCLLWFKWCMVAVHIKKIKHGLLCVADVYFRDIINTFSPVLHLIVSHLSISSSSCFLCVWRMGPFHLCVHAAAEKQWDATATRRFHGRRCKIIVFHFRRCPSCLSQSSSDLEIEYQVNNESPVWTNDLIKILASLILLLPFSYLLQDPAVIFSVFKIKTKRS